MARAAGTTKLGRYQVPAKHSLSARRQVVERVFGLLDAVFGLKFPGARTLWGLHTRLTAKVAAFNLAVYINHLYGRAPFVFFNPFLQYCASSIRTGGGGCRGLRFERDRGAIELHAANGER